MAPSKLCSDSAVMLDQGTLNFSTWELERPLCDLQLLSFRPASDETRPTGQTRTNTLSNQSPVPQTYSKEFRNTTCWLCVALRCFLSNRQQNLGRTRILDVGMQRTASFSSIVKDKSKVHVSRNPRIIRCESQSLDIATSDVT